MPITYALRDCECMRASKSVCGGVGAHTRIQDVIEEYRPIFRHFGALAASIPEVDQLAVVHNTYTHRLCVFFVKNSTPGFCERRARESGSIVFSIPLIEADPDVKINEYGRPVKSEAEREIANIEEGVDRLYQKIVGLKSSRKPKSKAAATATDDASATRPAKAPVKRVSKAKAKQDK